MRPFRLHLVLLAMAIASAPLRAHADTTIASQPAKPAPKAGWLDKLLGGRRGVLFYAYDTLAYPHQSVTLAARLEKSTLDKIKGVPIGFYDQEGRRIGTAQTDHSGQAFFDWTPGPAGDYRLTARIEREGRGLRKEFTDQEPAPLLVAVREKDTLLVVMDLDHTLVNGNAWDTMRDRAAPMPDAVEVTNRIARSYTPVYLTYRPDVLTGKSKQWLKTNGFPPGPLLVGSVRLLVKDDSRSFKESRLGLLRQAYPNVRIGIGDRLSDAQAYVDNGLTAYLIPRYRPKPHDMRELAEDIRKLRDGQQMQVVHGWREIEQGIFDSRHFPPESFADWLTDQAREMEGGKK